MAGIWITGLSLKYGERDVSFALCSWRGLLKHSRRARDYRTCYSMLFPRENGECFAGFAGVVVDCVFNGIAAPCFFSALSYFDGLRNFNSAANLIQAQRDYFGAHTYERTDAERGKFFHTDWTGKGGKTVSGTYNV